eukprot:jgi/Tetstr1/452291/TSEL_039327.t1
MAIQPMALGIEPVNLNAVEQYAAGARTGSDLLTAETNRKTAQIDQFRKGLETAGSIAIGAMGGQLDGDVDLSLWGEGMDMLEANGIDTSAFRNRADLAPLIARSSMTALQQIQTAQNQQQLDLAMAEYEREMMAALQPKPLKPSDLIEVSVDGEDHWFAPDPSEPGGFVDTGLKVGGQTPDSVIALQMRAQEAGLIPGTDEYSEFMQSGGAGATGTSAAEDKIARLMELGYSRDEAIRVSDLSVLAQDETGRQTVIDRATGAPIGAPPATRSTTPDTTPASPAPSPTAPNMSVAPADGPFMSQTDARPSFSTVPSGTNVGSALGAGGMVSGAVNSIVDTVTGRAPFPDQQQAANALEKLRMQTITALMEPIAGRPSVFTQEMIDRIVVRPNMGEANALDRFQQTQTMIDQQIRRLESEVLGNEGAWTPEQILDHLSQGRPNFDVQGARDAGYDDAEIAQFMATGDVFSRSAFGAVGAVPRGANTGLAAVVGAPVDLVNAGLGAIGVPVSEKPFGGSASIREGMNALGATFSNATGGTGAPITYERITDLPPDERMGAVAGEVVGSSLPIAMAPVAAAAAGARGGMVTGPILEAARSNPARFMGAEAGGIAGAAQGAALAEGAAPGNDMARIGGEMAGALINPAGTVGRMAGGMTNTAKNFLAQFSKPGQNRRAAEYIVNTFQATGEDPSRVLAALRAANELNIPGTVGQATGSPTVLAIERKLSDSSAQFAADRAVLDREGLEALRSAVDDLAASGDPDALTAAARLRGDYYDELMRSRLADAQEAAQTALGRLATEGQPGRATASAQAHEALSSALTDARRIESDLWGQIPRDVPLSGQGVQGAYQSIRSQMLPDDNLSAPIEAFIERLQSGQQMTSGDFLNLRRDALAAARAASSGDAPNRQLAEMYGQLANGALTDLGTVPGESLDAARRFSNDLHGAFSRTFANLGITETGAGAPRIAPELLLERAFGSGGTRGDVQFQQLQTAAEFPGLQGSEQGAQLGPRMEQAQESFLRSTALQRGTNPNTGEAMPNALGRFLMTNENALGRFPGVGQDISLAVTAQRALEQVQGRSRWAAEALGANSPLGQLIRSGTPQQAASKALAQGPDAFIRLANTARKGGPQALEGLGAATLDALMTQSTTANGFNFARFNDLLTRAPNGAQQSTLDLMVSQGALQPDAADRLRQIMDRAATMETARQSGQQIDELVAPPDMLSDLLTRIIAIAPDLPEASELARLLMLALQTPEKYRAVLKDLSNAELSDELQFQGAFKEAIELVSLPDAEAIGPALSKMSDMCVAEGITRGLIVTAGAPRDNLGVWYWALLASAIIKVNADQDASAAATETTEAKQ